MSHSTSITEKEHSLPTHHVQQSGAVGACWAHNPKVDGSKPSSAKTVVFIFVYFASYLLNLKMIELQHISFFMFLLYGQIVYSFLFHDLDFAMCRFWRRFIVHNLMF